MVIVELNRPSVFHAMNIEMIRDLTAAIAEINKKADCRIILLRSAGKHFSAGADLEWMREGLNQSESRLKEESMELAGLFRMVSETSPLIVTAVQGKILGGAVGLVAASDLVIAEESATFAFPEVKLGLVPATIAPFVVKKTGRSHAAAWMLTGRPFSAREAREAGLVHFTCADGTLAEETGRLLEELKANGPEALKGIRQLLNDFDFNKDKLEVQRDTSAILARCRVSPEGQEGMNAFFEKRKPDWDDSN